MPLPSLCHALALMTLAATLLLATNWIVPLVYLLTQ